MRIGITGVAGFIGSHLADAFLLRGDEVVGVDNLSMGSLANIEHHRENPRLRFHELDVRDLDAMRAAFRSVDRIVHLAAFKIPRYGNAIETLEVNNLGGRNVLEIARDGQRRVVLASTSDVYGKNPGVPFREDSDSLIGPSTIPRWSYAVSKLFDEHLAFAYQATHGVPITILRFFGSYGPRQHLSWWGGPQSVFISAILRDEPMEIHGDGMQSRSFTYISDLVDGIVRATDFDGMPAALFNLGNTVEITILELARLIKELCDTPHELKLKRVPYSSLGKYEDVMRRVPDISLARRVLGFDPRVDLRTGLGTTIAWQRKAMAMPPAGSLASEGRGHA
ncbi:MAG: GDP-mannose 4,6-dehydratase [Planctomycetes bacterium]|nr:GDP-mannose 4,6-dehydratase [Planctomycetota bacterium]